MSLNKINNPTKLVQAAEWVAENHEAKRLYFEKMAERLRKYPVSEKEQFYFDEVESVGGFTAVLDAVFGEDPHLEHDGMEGLREAAIKVHQDFIRNRAEHGFDEKKSFKKSLHNKPFWFKQEVAKAEQVSSRAGEYERMLKEIIESDEQDTI